MILYRYICRQLLASVFSISGILLLVLLGSQATRLLSRAIADQQGVEGVLLLLLFSIPELLIDILPAALVLSGILVISRLHLQNEISVMLSTGFSETDVLSVFAAIGFGAAIVMWALLMVINPAAKDLGNRLFDRMQENLVNNALTPGRFLELQGNTIYLAGKDADGQLQQMFVAQPGKQVLVAQQAELQAQQQGEIRLLLKQGQQLEGQALLSPVVITQFQQLTFTIFPSLAQARDHISYQSWQQLRANAVDQRHRAEWHRRLSLPLMAIIIPFLVYPLAYADQRSGKRANIIQAILLFVLYTMIFDAMRRSLSRGDLPLFPGSLMVHALFIGITLILWNKERIKRVWVRKR